MTALEQELPTRIGRFEVTGLVGGTVFRAFDPELQRTVAIKLLAPGEEPLSAVARIAHPNVVAVHEIGRDRGRAYLVMELVDGVSLRQWLAEQPRSVDEIRGRMRHAAAGLAAVHGRGVVHGDVSLDTILVGGDGRARIADFGAASVAAPGGTATDLRAFAQTMIDALLGERASDAERRLAERGVERRLRDALLRPRSLRELIAALDRAPRRRALWVAAGAAVSAVGGAFLAQALAPAKQPSCGASAALLAGHWDDSRRADVRTALGAAFQMTPAETAREVIEPVDAHAAEWLRVRDETCRAELAPERRAARLRCLDRRLIELDATGHALEHVPTRDRAAGRVAALTALAPCADADPEAEPTAAQRDALVQVTRQLFQVQDRYFTGRVRTTDIGLVEQLERDVGATGDTELTIRVMRWHGWLLLEAARYAESEKVARAAYELANKSDLPTAAAESILDVVKIEIENAQLSAADGNLRVALALLERPGVNPRARTRLYQTLSKLSVDRGDVPGARRYLAKARAEFAQSDARESANTRSGFEIDEARIDELDGKYDSALDHARRARELTIEYGGPRHPNIANILGTISLLQSRLGRFDDARVSKLEQVDLLATLVPADNPRLQGAREGLASAAIRAGDLATGIKIYEDALERSRKNPATNRPAIFHNLAGAYWDLGNRPRALELQQRSVDESETRNGAAHPDLAIRLLQLAEFEMVQGSLARAGADLDRAAPILAKLRADHPHRMSAAAFRIDLLRRKRDFPGAQRVASETLRLAEERKLPDREREDLWRAIGELQEARRDLRGARATYERLRAELVGRHANAGSLARADMYLGRVDYAMGKRAAGLARIRAVLPLLERTGDERYALHQWAAANRIKL